MFVITHKLQESEPRLWIEGAEDDVRIEPISRPRNAHKTMKERSLMRLMVREDTK